MSSSDSAEYDLGLGRPGRQTRWDARSTSPLPQQHGADQDLPMDDGDPTMTNAAVSFPRAGSNIPTSDDYGYNHEFDEIIVAAPGPQAKADTSGQHVQDATTKDPTSEEDEDDDSTVPLHLSTQRSVIRSQVQHASQGISSPVDNVKYRRTSLQGRALRANDKGIYPLVMHLLRRDKKDHDIINNGPDPFCDDPRLPAMYVSLLLSYSEPYINSVILGDQEDFLNSDEIPPTPAAKSSGDPQAIGVIYGNFLAGPNGEKATIHHLERIAMYFKRYIKGLIVVPPAQSANFTSGPRAKVKATVQRPYQSFNTGALVFKIDSLEGSIAGSVRAHANQQAKSKGSSKITSFIGPQPNTRARSPSKSSADIDDDGSSEDDEDWEAENLSAAQASKVVTKNSTRRFVSTGNKLESAQKWLGQLEELIGDAYDRGLGSEDPIDRSICDIGWTYNAPKRRDDHETYQSSIQHMNLVDAICRVFLGGSNLGIRFVCLHLVLREEDARYDEHTMSRFHMAYISEGGFNTARAGLSNDARKKITNAKFNELTEQVAQRKVYIDRYNDEMKRMEEEIRKLKFIQEFHGVKTEYRERRQDWDDNKVALQEKADELHEVEGKLQTGWDTTVQTFDKTHKVMEQADHVLHHFMGDAGNPTDLSRRLDELHDVCKRLPIDEDDTTDEEA